MMRVIINGERYLPEALTELGMCPFHELISAARYLNDETLDEAAKGIGTTKSHLWTMEKGGSQPGLPILQKILRYYNFKFEDIAPTDGVDLNDPK